jgi:hypothetical protein
MSSDRLKGALLKGGPDLQDWDAPFGIAADRAQWEISDRAFSALLRPEHLWGPFVLNPPWPAPRHAGVYAWYFAEAPPGVPTEGCHHALGHTLLYVGIAPKETRGATTKHSERTLHCRLADHFRGNAEGSTLRLTLGCLLSNVLGVQLRRVGSGRRLTFTNAGEQILDAWMAQNARVVWAAVDRPWEIEKPCWSRCHCR